MTNQTTASEAPAAYDPVSTLAIALELSGKSWELGAVLPGVPRRPRRRLDPRDMPGHDGWTRADRRRLQFG